MLVFPTVVSYLLVPIGLKYLKTTLVAMYGYVTLIVATVASLLLGQDRFGLAARKRFDSRTRWRTLGDAFVHITRYHRKGQPHSGAKLAAAG